MNPISPCVDPPPAATDTEAQHYDFLPTACEIAGAEPPKKIDGISYLPTLLGNDEQQKQHEYLYCASSEGATAVGVRYGKWKLVQYRTKDGTSPDWRLYDLSKDVGEQNNVAAGNPETVKTILKLLERDGLL